MELSQAMNLSQSIKESLNQKRDDYISFLQKTIQEPSGNQITIHYPKINFLILQEQALRIVRMLWAS